LSFFSLTESPELSTRSDARRLDLSSLSSVLSSEEHSINIGVAFSRNNPFETDLSAFHNVAQDTLHQIVTAVEAVEGDIEIPEFDIKETVRLLIFCFGCTFQFYLIYSCFRLFVSFFRGRTARHPSRLPRFPASRSCSSRDDDVSF